MKLKTLLTGILAAGFVFGAMSGCSSTPNVPTREMPAGASFDGLWYSDEFGEMHISVKADNTMHATFEYQDGYMDGRVEGGVMLFEWVQPGDFQNARREVRGHGYLVISDDGLEMSGHWGYSNNYDGGGKWTGRKATEIY